MTNLKDLADRVEALTEPCRETDLRIGVAVNYGGHFAEGKRWHWNANSELECNGRGYLDPRLLPRFTASVDAALTLAPEGFHIAIDFPYTTFPITFRAQPMTADSKGNWTEHSSKDGISHNRACAITAACLRARDV